MRWRVFAGLLVIFAGACSLAGPPNAEGLRAGKYRVQFDVAAGSTVPAIVVGHHDFTFAVVEPTTFTDSFVLQSAMLGTTPSYLSQDLNETIPGEELWVVSWKIFADPRYRVSVRMNEETGGQFSLPSGCHVFDDLGADFVGTNCSVTRAD